MIIFYTNSFGVKEKKQDTFDFIVSTIKSLGHKVVGPETHKYNELINLEKAKKRQDKISIHNQFIRKAIELSDASIIEASRYSFKLGQESQIALDKKIPVLCLANEIDYSEKVQDPFFYSSIYHSDAEIKSAIKTFLKTVESKHLNKRINVFLHNKHLSYLNWYVKNHEGTNRSEVIRESLERLMDSDNEYQKR